LLVESFSDRNACKIKGVSAGVTSVFECTIAENAKVETCKFREILTLFLWPFSNDCKFIVSVQGKLQFRGRKIEVSP
jgi:hypothetical protein